MDEKKQKNKEKTLDILLIIGLIILIAFVIITSIVINKKKKDLDDLNDDIEKLPAQEEETNRSLKEPQFLQDFLF